MSSDEISVEIQYDEIQHYMMRIEYDKCGIWCVQYDECFKIQ